MKGLCCSPNTVLTSEVGPHTETKDLLVLSKNGGQDFIFDTQTKERTSLNKSRVFGLKNTTAASVNKKVYLFGGSVKQSGVKMGCNRVETLDFNSTNPCWQKSNNLPFKGMYMSAASYQGKIYLIGGVSLMKNNKPENFIKNIHVYNISKNKWTKLGEIITARIYHKSVAYDDKIFTFGGIDHTMNYTNKVEQYDITTNISSTITVLPKLISFIGAVEIDGMIFVLGGKCDGAEFDRSPTQHRRVFLKFDSSALVWEDVVGRSNHTRASSSVCAVGGRVVTAGGLKNKATVIEIFDYPRRKWDSEKGYLESDKWTNQQVVAL